jgi:hypothetical protein
MGLGDRDTYTYMCVHTWEWMLCRVYECNRKLEKIEDE